MTILIVKIISSFIIPPGIFIVIFFALSKVSKSKKVKYVALVSGILMYVLSTFFGLYLISYPLENAYPTPNITKDPSSITIVLSGGITYHSGEEQLSRSTFKRLYKGFKVARKTKGKILVSGGKIFNNDSIASSHLMKEALMEFGFPENKIIVQDKSRNTYEDALYSKKILEKEKEDKIYLVTSAMHLKRSMDIFKKTFKGVEIIPVPSDFIVDEKVNVLQFFPNFGVFFTNCFAIHEILGKIWYDIGG